MIHRRGFATLQPLWQASIRSAWKLPSKVHPHYAHLPNRSQYSLVWEDLPRNVCVIKKPWNPNVRSALVSFVTHLHKQYPLVNILVEKDAAEEIQPDLEDGVLLHTGDTSTLQSKTDLIVTLGGDGTILHAASMFANSRTVPPILSFSMGTLGFLLPFDFKDAQDAFYKVYTSQAQVMNRFRLQCGDTAGATHAMNDLTIHRGQEPHLTMLDISVNGQFVTTAIADGVTIATPTGSTAYSLSSGGSIIHPSVACILITPICPRSLSFRPLVFPSSAKINIKVSPHSRGSAAELSIDGIRKGALKPGDDITVQSESTGNSGLWCVTKTDHDWVTHVNSLLGFNSPFGTRNYDLPNDIHDSN